MADTSLRARRAAPSPCATPSAPSPISQDALRNALTALSDAQQVLSNLQEDLTATLASAAALLPPPEASTSMQSGLQHLRRLLTRTMPSALGTALDAVDYSLGEAEAALKAVQAGVQHG